MPNFVFTTFLLEWESQNAIYIPIFLLSIYFHFSMLYHQQICATWSLKAMLSYLSNSQPTSNWKSYIAERGFDPRTSGLWAQHASTAPLCSCISTHSHLPLNHRWCNTHQCLFSMCIVLKDLYCSFYYFSLSPHNNYAHHLSFLCFSTCSPWMGHGKSTPRSQPFCNTISAVLDSIVVSIPACHAGDRGSIPRRGGAKSFSLRSLTFDWIFLWEAAKHAWRWRFCI